MSVAGAYLSSLSYEELAIRLEQRHAVHGGIAYLRAGPRPMKSIARNLAAQAFSVRHIFKPGCSEGLT